MAGWTDASGCNARYNRFTIGFARMVRGITAGTPPVPLATPSLGIGIHWPSMLSEDAGSYRNWLEAASFYTMEKRADNIGENAGYLVLRSLFEHPLKRITLIGHSFGCKVVSHYFKNWAQDRSKMMPPRL